MAVLQGPAPDANLVAHTKLLSTVSRGAVLCAAFALTPSMAFAQTTTETDAGTDEVQTTSEDTQEIVVTGVRAAIARGLETKRNANSIVDSISAEDIGKLPDSNIAEAIQRVPGVAIDRSGGEGRYITINGLGPQFSLTLLNGRQIASSEASRSFAFDTIAANLVHQIDVYKSLNANIPEGGLGGTVNVKTARPFNFDGFTASALVSFQYDENSKKGHPQASFVVADQFFDDRLGILLSFTHQRRSNTVYQTTGTAWSKNYFVDPVTAAYVEDDLDEAWRSWDIQYGRLQSERERNGGTAVIQARPTDTITLTADYLYSKFDVEERRDSGGAYLWAVQDTPNSILDENGSYRQLDIGLHLPYDVCNAYNPALPVSATNRSCRASYSWNNNETFRPTTTQLAGFNAEWKPADDFSAVLDIFWSQAINDNKGLNRNHTFEMGQMPGYFVIFPEDGSAPNFDLGGFDLAAHDHELRVRRFGNTGTYTKAVNKGTTADFDYKITPDLSFRFGGSYAEIAKANDSYATPSAITGLYWCCSIDAPPNLDQVLNGIMWADERFGVKGDPYPVFLINGDGLRAWAADENNLKNHRTCPATSANQCGYVDYVANGRTFNAVRSASSYKVEEKDISLYGQMDGNMDIGSVPVNIVAGLRYSRTQLTSSGTNVVLIGFDGRSDKQLVPVYEGETLTNRRPLVPVSAKNTYEYFLPSVNVKAEVLPDVILRFSANKTMTRPTLNDISPAFNYGGFGMADNQRTASGNNPNLKPFTSSNLDASAEFYYSRNGAIAVAGFLKEAENFIVRKTETERLGTIQFVRNVIDFDGTSYPLDKAQTFRVTRPHNAAEATIKGITASWTHSFDFGVGFQANFTKLWSSVKTEPGAAPYSVPGISDTANLIAFYEKGPISARVAYNWRSGFVVSPASGETLEVNTAAYQQVDARIGLDIGWGINVGLDVVNLTKEKVRQYGRYKDQFVGYWDYGRQFNLSVSKKF